jgi:inorganic pyrophosphatase
MLFPANYGFMPQSVAVGNVDPMEVLVLNQGKPCAPLSFMKARPIGVLALRDTEGKVTRKVLLAVHHDDPVYNDVGGAAGLYVAGLLWLAGWGCGYLLLGPGVYAAGCAPLCTPGRLL